MRVLLILVVFLLGSCKGPEKIHGTYVDKGKDYKYTLTINADSTFVLNDQNIYSKSSCKGKWQQRSDTLYLICDDEEFPAQIASNYMQDREKTVVIINNSKLKIDSLILKKK